MSGPLAAAQQIFDRDITAERWRQLKLWGPQHHPDGTGSVDSRQQANAARRSCQDAFEFGTGTWRHVLLEELFEALAETEHAKLRKELVEVATVCVAWIEDIDGRAGDRVSTVPDVPELAATQSIGAGVAARQDIQRKMVSA